MPNPKLNADQLTVANGLLLEIRNRLEMLSGGDASVLWALRRKVAKELVYDERGKPGHRRKLKTLKRAEQKGMCPECRAPLPLTYCVLDRFAAEAGYTPENTRLLCQECDFRIQKERGYA